MKTKITIIAFLFAMAVHGQTPFDSIGIGTISTKDSNFLKNASTAAVANATFQWNAPQQITIQNAAGQRVFFDSTYTPIHLTTDTLTLVRFMLKFLFEQSFENNEWVKTLSNQTDYLLKSIEKLENELEQEKKKRVNSK